MDIIQSRPIYTFPLPQKTINSLIRNGYLTWKDLMSIDLRKIQEECVLTQEEIESIQQIAHIDETLYPLGVTALELKAVQNTTITTCMGDFDDLLDGGLPIGVITEVYGATSSGKSQMAMQLCLSVQIPAVMSGLEGEAIYIDTENNISLSRLKEMAVALNTLMTEAAEENNLLNKLPDISVDTLLSHIYVWSIEEYSDLLLLLKALPRFLSTHPNIRLLIIDSIYYPLRSNNPKIMKFKIILEIGQLLYSLANQFNLAVFATNKMMIYSPPMPPPPSRQSLSSPISIQQNTQKQTKDYIPLLGPTWTHLVSIRLHISQEEDNKRYITVEKCPSIKQCKCEFQINEKGLRSIEVDSQSMVIETQ
ncbi:hypothetical protein WA158_005299 [Blastocystis sp. Blastoise]